MAGGGLKLLDLGSTGKTRADLFTMKVVDAVTVRCSFEYFFLILIQFNVLFKIISLIETSQSIGGAKRQYPGNTT